MFDTVIANEAHPAFSGARIVYNTFEQMLRGSTRAEFSIGTSHVFYVPVVHHMSFIAFWLLCRSQVSAFPELFLYQQVMDRLSFHMSTVASIDDFSGHNMWNPLLELLFLEHVTGIVDSFLKDIDLAKIAFSCHFALDLHCYKEEVLVST